MAKKRVLKMTFMMDYYVGTLAKWSTWHEDYSRYAKSFLVVSLAT